MSDADRVRKAYDPWWVYLVRCERDGTYYCGVTTDVERRVGQHNAGTGARYTRGRRPVILVWCERVTGLGAALRREAVVKRMTRAVKEGLVVTWAKD